MKKEFNPPIRTYPSSLESQNWLVPIQIGYLIVYHTVRDLLMIKTQRINGKTNFDCKTTKKQSDIHS